MSKNNIKYLLISISFWGIIIILACFKVYYYRTFTNINNYRYGYVLNYVEKKDKNLYALEFQDLVLYKTVPFNIPYGSYAYIYFDNYSDFAGKKYIFHNFKYSYDKKFSIEFLLQFRKNIESYLSNKYDSTSAEIAKSLTLGTSITNVLIKEEIYSAGIAHIFVLSGQHLLIISYFITILINRVRVKSNFKKALVIITLLFYLLLVGLQFSLIRSYTMLLFSTIFFETKQMLPNLLKLLMLLLLFIIIFPFSLNDLGLYFSFTAVLAIYYLSRFNIKNQFLKLISLSFTINLFLLPLTLLYFNRVNLNGVVSSIFLSAYVPIIYITLVVDYLFSILFTEIIISFLNKFLRIVADMPFDLYVENNLQISVFLTIFIVFLVLDVILQRSLTDKNSHIK